MCTAAVPCTLNSLYWSNTRSRDCASEAPSRRAAITSSGPSCTLHVSQARAPGLAPGSRTACAADVTDHLTGYKKCVE